MSGIVFCRLQLTFVAGRVYAGWSFGELRPGLRVQREVSELAMRTVLRSVALFLSAFIGLWAVIHGIILVVALRTEPGHEDILRHLAEGSISIAGGICVLSVAVEQLYCMRTHRKDDSLI